MTSAAASAVTATLRGNFGRLWSRGHETLLDPAVTTNSRRILSVSGPNVQAYLQGLVTCDLMSPPVPPREEVDDGLGEAGAEEVVEFTDAVRSACFLDNKGRILTDSLLWKAHDEHYYIDIAADNSSKQGDAANSFLQHLQMFRTRRQRKIQIEDVSDRVSSHVIFGTQTSTSPPGYLSGLDPRHPSLGLRLLNVDGGTSTQDFTDMIKGADFPHVPGTYDLVRRLAGIAEGSSELESKIALECNQEFANAVSFAKGCYLGQELTARVQHTGAIRKRIVPLFLTTTQMQIPPSWMMASQVQSGAISTSTLFETTGSRSLPPLPRLSVAAAGSLVGMMTGQVDSSTASGTEEDENLSEELAKLRQQAAPLLDYCQSKVQRGDKIVDTKDGKTIGQIISPPLEGTNVVLAQMRLDRLGLLDGGKKSKSADASKSDQAVDAKNAKNANGWNHMNKVTIGEDETELRYLPYLPLWWPEIDPSTGKAKEAIDEE